MEGLSVPLDGDPVPPGRPTLPRWYDFAYIPAPPTPFIVLLSRYPRRLGDALKHRPHLGEAPRGGAHSRTAVPISSAVMRSSASSGAPLL
jgi:hypothetical protein